MKTWNVSDLSETETLDRNVIELENGEHFHLAATPSRIVFGGACNVGLLESGYIEREDGESLDDTLAELLSDLETFHTDGPGYTSRIVCNGRMDAPEGWQYLEGKALWEHHVRGLPLTWDFLSAEGKAKWECKAQWVKTA